MFSIGLIIRCLYARINVYNEGKSYDLKLMGFHVTLFVSVRGSVSVCICIDGVFLFPFLIKYSFLLVEY